LESVDEVDRVGHRASFTEYLDKLRHFV
jgi:hypothetical protein